MPKLTLPFSSPSVSTRPASPAGEASSLLPQQGRSRRAVDLSTDERALDSEFASPSDTPGADLAHAKSYRSMTSRGEEAALSSLPARLSRAQSISRKRERKPAKQTRWQSLTTRARYYIPVLDWLPRYNIRQLGGDVTAALTLTSLIVPQSMSYSTALVGSDPVYGLFAAAIPAMLYSVLGTCRQLSVGPEAALSLITGEMIARFVEDEEHAHGKMGVSERAKLVVVLTTIVTFQAGLVTFLLGFFRLGFLDAVLSRALLRGFMTAVGLVIFVTQAISILGIEKGLVQAHGASSSVIVKVEYILTHLGDTHRLTLFVSLVALAILVLAKLFKRRLAQRKGFRFLLYVPEVLVVVLASTLLSHLLSWHSHGLATLGRVSAGAVKFRVPFLNWTAHHRAYFTKTFGTATTVAVLGFLDSIVAAKDMGSKYDYPISPNRELCALGFANVFNSFCRGSITGFGSLTRSRLAAATGATTQMASLLTGVAVITTTYTLLGWLESLPKCILAVVVCVVVFSILEEAPHDVNYFWKMRAWVDGGLMLLTFFLSLFVSVEVGIIVSVALSMVLCIKQSTRIRINLLARIPNTTLYEPLESDSEEDGSSNTTTHDDNEDVHEELPGVLIARIRDVSLTFANTGALKERLRRLERYGAARHHPSDAPRRAEASVVVFHLADVAEVDASACQILGEIAESYAGRSVLVYWTGGQGRVLERLRRAGVVEKSGGEQHVQRSVPLALQQLHDSVADVVGPAAADQAV
ncbi:hypothetical protein JCM8547_000863 [Rhodosporidiobolus lusitaniae]